MAAIGIDLGTTNSLIGFWTPDGTQLIPNVYGSYLTPSVVSVGENGEIFVGEIAKERRISHPLMTASAFKRHVGTQKKYHLGPYTFSSEELSSFVLKSLKADAEAYLERKICEAIISVPAYFNDVQRKATVRAADMAGLRVKRLISEPTAAAIAYGLHQKDSSSKFLVLDLGGGTFDVSILELFEGIMDVKAVAGDVFLGGEDFTQALISHYIKKFNLDSNKMDPILMSEIYTAAEKCKRELTANENCEMGVIRDGQKDSLVITRADFDAICEPLYSRLRVPIERAMHDAKIKSGDLDAIVLVGGATRMPNVRFAAAKMFGRLPFTNINPDEAIARGAAVQAALAERDESLEEMILTDVCPFSLGTDVVYRSGNRMEGGFFCPIIERNTSIPVSRREYFSTIRDYQKKVKFSIYQGESRKVEDNLFLGEIEVSVPQKPAGEERIEVRFTYNIDGILEVETCVVSTKESARLVIKNKETDISDAEIENRLQMIRNLKIHPRDREEIRLLIAKAERLYEQSLGEERSVIENSIREFEDLLNLQDEKVVKEATEKFRKMISNLEGEFTDI